eukprot:CAMPEP_0195589450 /NCGR_PEP_ID=MMETSP0814-20130614/33644_1 /TAXON_ID=97485 /ORGANISM="Prymnesium parvum, Strain Texoma1" /LENGTH=121 /DNA_ID=CAMNT_0040728477 /DNA_START=1056 /DNA_END=1418 /DNA_ORIENTATION=+
MSWLRPLSATVLTCCPFLSSVVRSCARRRARSNADSWLLTAESVAKLVGVGIGVDSRSSGILRARLTAISVGATPGGGCSSGERSSAGNAGLDTSSSVRLTTARATEKGVGIGGDVLVCGT